MRKKSYKVGSPRSRLAGYTPHGKIWINPYVPSKDRKRLRVHERTEYRLRRTKGMNYRDAHQVAGRKEVRGLTKHQVFVYSGRLGAVARWHPWHPRKRRLS